MFRSVMGGVHTEHREGFVFQTPRAPHYLLLCFESPFFCVINGERIEGGRGCCVLHRPGTPVLHGPLNAASGFVNHWIYFDAPSEEIAGLELPFDTPITLEDAAIIAHPIDRILKETVRNDAFSERLISDSIYRLLVILKRAERVRKSEDLPLRSRFKEVRVRILRQCGEPWTLRRMADLSGYSVSRFCALYKDFFGISPMNDLLERRLEMAMQMLRLGAYKVGDVAQLCGFSSIHYFSNFVKKRTGRSPADY